ncbi:MAG TPA: copper resistance protein CopC [Thermodesulfobacteriota bacterium]|nr:copper resistance protein CopC [Thermodesulfobacteriota bacterium]
MRLASRLTLISALILFGAINQAFGHAVPDHSEPAVGSTVNASPPIVRIWFDSELEGEFSAIRVENAASERVDKGDGRVDKSDTKLLEVDLPPLSSGVYRVYWTAVSRDGHRTEGNFTFTVK